MGVIVAGAQVDTKVLTTAKDVHSWRVSLLQENSSASDKPLIGLVPTMGALHKGHLELIRQARAACRNVIVSIFVNPAQFGPNEDFDKYPRTLEQDLKLCQQEGVDAIFHPGTDEIYPHGQAETTRVVPPPFLEKTLLGEYRPQFFGGIATVVLRLFNIVQPDIAYFGEKDYQQLLVVRRLVSDLRMPVTIFGVPTVREEDGLACSSRNTLLTTQQRHLAPELYRVLCSVRDAVTSGSLPLSDAIARGSDELSTLPDVSLKYLVACDPSTLKRLESTAFPMVLLAAAKFGEVWLIDTLR